MLPPVQRSRVVTSPMGEQEPPALEAMIIIQLNTKRAVRSGISFRAMEIITITVARLPNKMDMKKVIMERMHRSLRGRLALMELESTSKPPCESTMSIMAMEPSTKNRVVATSPMPRISFNSRN